MKKIKNYHWTIATGIGKIQIFVIPSRGLKNSPVMSVTSPLLLFSSLLFSLVFTFVLSLISFICVELIGSYCMDALAMALHCIYTTDSLVSALLKCANIRGDADSVCAVTGQIAG